MNYEFYTIPEKALMAMLQAISQAKKSIYIEMYIFSHNISNSHNFFEKIIEKTKEGVVVKIVVDAVGSFELKSSIIKELKNAGVEFLFFSHWLRRTHRKILIIDEQIAFLGGMNIHSDHSENDLQIRLTGLIVKPIIRSFAYTYFMAGGSDKKLINYREKSFTYKTKVWLLEHWPFKKKNTLKQYYLEKIKEAHKNITIVTPYFVPHKWLIIALDQAIQRGVVVDIILTQVTIPQFMTRVNYFYASKLSPIGINFFFTKEDNHAKAMLIDNTEGLIGSHNIDALSFDFNLEAGVFFHNPKMIKDLSNIIEQWKIDSIPFDHTRYKPKKIDHIKGLFLSFFQPIL